MALRHQIKRSSSLLFFSWSLFLSTCTCRDTLFVSGLSQGKELPLLPIRPNQVVSQAASAIRHAFFEDNMNHQTIRLPLSESMYSNKEEGFVADRAIGWQGGPQETLRFLSPLVSDVLQSLRPVEETGGLPPRISEQTLLDFDGSSLVTAESCARPYWRRPSHVATQHGSLLS